MAKKKNIVIYDGDCGFCQGTVNIIKNLDWLSKFEFIPFQNETILEKYNCLAKEKCEKEIFLIRESTNSKTYYAGYDAFKIVTLFLPITFLISWFFFLPGVSHSGKFVYKLIAENRHKIKIGKKVCKQ